MNSILHRIINRLKRILTFVFEEIKYYALFPFSFVIYPHNDIHLISERGKDARDNGYHFFKYLRTKHPEINAYYVIDRESPDYEKVSVLGKTVNYRSIQHYLLFIAAKYKISSHVMGCSPNAGIYISFNKKHHIPGKHIFLQHGIIKDNLNGLYKENAELDLFICGAKPEYEYVSKHFHYEHNEVRYTGLARYDELQKFKTDRIILFMPTWRVYVNNLNEEQFVETEYFKEWNALLNDPNLLNLIKKHNYKVLFYPHYEMQKYVHLFKNNNTSIVIADFEHYDVQTLLKSAVLLVTDFSSVFFDFAYMMKPIIFFQFDKNQFFMSHYQKGYFDYETMKFGDVVEKKDEVVKCIENSISNNFAISVEYTERIKEFFPLKDANNAERIFSAIEDLK